MAKIDFEKLRRNEKSRRSYFEHTGSDNKPVIINGPDYVLPFGKFKGTMLKDLPLDYIKWSILNMDSYRVNMFIRELQRRDPSYIVQ